MGLLNSASSQSVMRGYGLWEDKKILSYKQLSAFEYEGYVQGSQPLPYYVKINLKHPKKSYCDCPHANGYTVCKHMVAMYYAVFPEEADDLNSWMKSDGYYFDEDEEDEYYYRRTSYYDDNKPIFYDDLLESYLNDLSQEQMKEILMKELNRDENRTYNQYLKKYAKKNLHNINEDMIFLNKLNKKLKFKTKEPNYFNHLDSLFTSYEKNTLEKIYNKNTILNKKIDEILLNEKLAIYRDYQWVILFYKNRLSKKQRENLIKKLENYFNALKHYSITNPISKSNILIDIFLLNHYSMDELAESLVIYAKYYDYIQYVFENTNISKKLYYSFKKKVEEHLYENRSYIPDVFSSFYLGLHCDSEIIFDLAYYNFMYRGYTEFIDLVKGEQKEILIEKIFNTANDEYKLKQLYIYLKKYDYLYSLFKKTENDYGFLQHVNELSDDYSDELYERFKNKFYYLVSLGKDREIYKQASQFVKGISKLIDGKEKVNEFLNELRNSEYKNRSALLDEISKVLG